MQIPPAGTPGLRMSGVDADPKRQTGFSHRRVGRTKAQPPLDDIQGVESFQKRSSAVRRAKAHSRLWALEENTEAGPMSED